MTCLNFFFLDRDVEICASYHGDKHLNKMQLEYAQIASTVVRECCKRISLVLRKSKNRFDWFKMASIC